MVLLACVSLSACKSAMQSVQIVEKNTHDTIVVFETKRDSVFNTDSVCEYVYIKGDTVIHEKLKYKTKYKYSIKHDSIYINKIDTIERPVYVERELSRWQKIKLKYWWPASIFGVLSMLILLLVTIYCARKKIIG